MVRRTRPGISRFRVRCFASPRNDNWIVQDNAGRTFATGPAFGPHRVRITLAQDSPPSTPIETAASTKKFAADALWVESHQPPTLMNTSRAVCASTGPSTLAAPCEEKYIADARPMKPYIGAAVAK